LPKEVVARKIADD